MRRDTSWSRSSFASASSSSPSASASGSSASAAATPTTASRSYRSAATSGWPATRQESEYGPLGHAGIGPFIDPFIGRVLPNSPAAKAGLHAGDRIVAVNGRPVIQYSDFLEPLTKGAKLEMQLQRGPTTAAVTLPATTVDPNDLYRGIVPRTQIHKLSLVPAIQDSFEQNWKMLKYAGIAVARIFRGEG